jgi:hypothetical protein
MRHHKLPCPAEPRSLVKCDVVELLANPSSEDSKRIRRLNEFFNIAARDLILGHPVDTVRLAEEMAQFLP